MPNTFTAGWEGKGMQERNTGNGWMGQSGATRTGKMESQKMKHLVDLSISRGETGGLILARTESL